MSLPRSECQLMVWQWYKQTWIVRLCRAQSRASCPQKNAPSAMTSNCTPKKLTVTASACAMDNFQQVQAALPVSPHQLWRKVRQLRGDRSRLPVLVWHVRPERWRASSPKLHPDCKNNLSTSVSQKDCQSTLFLVFGVSVRQQWNCTDRTSSRWGCLTARSRCASIRDRSRRHPDP